MVSRATGYWRSMLCRIGGHRPFATWTTPTMKPFAPPSDAALSQALHSKTSRQVKGDLVPVYVALGMIMLSVSLGLYTAKHELLYSPTVYVRKKKRETLPELEDPDHVVDEADKFVKKSLFRKAAHIQDDKEETIPNPMRGDPFNSPRRVETLKSIGVEL
ncbi:PREDICTED: uncharacterized protein LOC104603194 [Nelumbo nucifera]|uniref:Uncharacterized protein n=2 Tax=Nelumbo nucifera TaxID=4432 RepID=A0A822ZQG4_NELNU|nr:PREDICTED: uncharacterized protein LOC104603194 [Nelumbo nucifera]DAD45751.1 TPA_asm: hypothetical protein HUJ06_003981 [Nelumbo nucifera]